MFIDAGIVELLEKIGDPVVKELFYRFMRVLEDIYKGELGKLRESVNAILEAHKGWEERFNRIEKTIAEIVRIQEDTKNTLRELAEAQRRTEERLGKVEARLDRLEENQKKIREQLGGLAHTVGYSLEDKAYKGLPGLIQGFRY